MTKTPEKTKIFYVETDVSSEETVSGTVENTVPVLYGKAAVRLPSSLEQT